MKSFFSSFFFSLLFGVLATAAPSNIEALALLRGPHYFFAGPEVYHLWRERAGGTWQEGTLSGVHAGYDRIRGMSIYWGVDGYWARGELNGSSARGLPFASQMTDSDIQGRLGYTLYFRSIGPITLSLFIGGGYFCERNSFHPPSPMEVEFRTSFAYTAFGGYLRLYLAPNTQLGIDFRAEFPVEGHCTISEGVGENKEIKLLFNSQTQYALEAPLIYFFGWKKITWGVGLVPFYRYRHYGGREGFPFDFFDTRISVAGGRLQLMGRF